jgi:hypothetical protein
MRQRKSVPQSVTFIDIGWGAGGVGVANLPGVAVDETSLDVAAAATVGRGGAGVGVAAAGVALGAAAVAVGCVVGATPVAAGPVPAGAATAGAAGTVRAVGTGVGAGAGAGEQAATASIARTRGTIRIRNCLWNFTTDVLRSTR